MAPPLGEIISYLVNCSLYDKGTLEVKEGDYEVIAEYEGVVVKARVSDTASGTQKVDCTTHRLLARLEGQGMNKGLDEAIEWDNCDWIFTKA